jgi:3D (Asp-Asp-Asp) domain-containing protein
MKNLIRGGAILSLLSLFVVFIYAQTQTESTPAIGSESQPAIENSIDDTLVNTQANQTNTDTTNKKKLVKTTASIKSTAAGASRGSFSASAYCFSGKTAMGHPVRRGLIAADPRVLKLGSRVYVEAGPWSGTYLVSDTGGAIKGKKIDIWVPNCSEARRFGRRSVNVFAAQ